MPFSPRNRPICYREFTKMGGSGASQPRVCRLRRPETGTIWVASSKTHSRLHPLSRYCFPVGFPLKPQKTRPRLHVNTCVLFDSSRLCDAYEQIVRACAQLVSNAPASFSRRPSGGGGGVLTERMPRSFIEPLASLLGLPARCPLSQGSGPY